MTQDQLQDQTPPPRPPSHGRLVVAGMAAACALGAGLGLWARPTPPGPGPQPQTPAPPSQRALQIVVDDTPAPIGPLLEVLPGDAAPGPPPLAAKRPHVSTTPVEPVVPRRPASGLVRVDAPVVAEPLPVFVAPSAPRPRLRTGVPVKIARAAPPKAKTAETRAAATRLPKADRHVAARAEREKTVRVAKAAKVEKARTTSVAKAEAKPMKAKARSRRLAMLERPARATPRRVAAPAAGKPAVQHKAVQVARAEPPAGHKAVRLAEARPRATPARTAKPARLEKAATPRVATPAPKRVKPRGEGPMRIARAAPDPRLSVREHQLEQAWRNAEAAGVPASALRRQQERWRVARAAAAREAPWAVEDVYEARISELNDLSRGARAN